MVSKSPLSPKDDEDLMRLLWSPELTQNPLNFVMAVYPWGQKGTPLENHKGPRGWQKEVLVEITNTIKDNQGKLSLDLDPEVFKEAVCSGRGIGKSAFFSWFTHYLLSTALGSTVIVTANTEAQLKTRTWAEMGKWLTLSINSHWFERNALSIKPADWFDNLLRSDLKIDTGYYYAAAQLWSEENPDAFAGTHNHHGIAVLYDEASGIPHPIWKVTEGFFTEPILHRYWMAFSNGRRNTGKFFECFHKDRNFWRTRNIDSRTVEGTDKAYLQSIVDKYGEDSDEARVEVMGLFPRQGDTQFISREAVQQAQARELFPDNGAPLIMGVDVARFGDDRSVVRMRRGRDGRTYPKFHYKGLPLNKLGDMVADHIDKYKPDAVAIDGGGVGGGLVDYLRFRGYKVIEVQFGEKASDADKYVSIRAEIWGNMRAWVDKEGCLDPKDQALAEDMTNPEYDFDDKGRYRLESKESMKRRGLNSPDDGDAFALTFAVKTSRRDAPTSRGRSRMAEGVDYPIFG
jgi:hypothetical protein